MRKLAGFVFLMGCVILGAIGCPSKSSSPSSPAAPTNTPVPTGTPTGTPTITGTPTNSATPCTTVVFQATYTFNNGINCWAVDGGSQSRVTGFGTSSSEQYSGTNSLEVAVNNNSGVVTTVQVEINYPVAQNLGGASVTLWVYVDSHLFNSNEGIAVFDQNTGYTGWEASDTSVTSGGTWIQYVHSGLANTSVIQLGVQLYNIPIGQSGNFYIDDVSITVPTSPTATPTNTPTPVETWTFTSSSASGWVTESGNVAGTVMSLIEPGYSGTSTDYCINLNAPFTTYNQTAGIQQGFTTPLNLTGGGISCYMWMDTGTVTGGYPGGQIFPTDSSGNVSYSYYQNLTQGAWTQLNLAVSSSAWGSVNAAAITQIAIQAGDGGTSTETVTTGNVKIDDIVAY